MRPRADAGKGFGRLGFAPAGWIIRATVAGFAVVVFL